MDEESRQKVEATASRRKVFILWLVLVLLAVRFGLGPATGVRWRGALVLLAGLSFGLVWRLVNARRIK